MHAREPAAGQSATGNPSEIFSQLQTSLKENPRWLAIVGGVTLAAIGLSRRSLGGLAAAVGGGYLTYCASTGRWPRAEWLKSVAARLQSRLPEGPARPALARAHEPQTHTEPDARQWPIPVNADLVDEASMESFPASDPPSFMTSPGTQSRRYR